MPPVYEVSTRSFAERLLFTLWSIRIRGNHNRNSVGTPSRPPAALVLGFVGLTLWYCMDPNQVKSILMTGNKNIAHNKDAAYSTLVQVLQRLPQLVRTLLESAKKSKSTPKQEERELESLILKERIQPDLTIMDHSACCLCGSVRFMIRAPRSLMVKQPLQTVNDFPKVGIAVKNLALKEGSENLRNFSMAPAAVKHTFCAKCGTHLFQTPNDGSRQILVNTLCLKSDWIELPNKDEIMSSCLEKTTPSQHNEHTTASTRNSNNIVRDDASTAISTITGGAGTLGSYNQDDDEDWSTPVVSRSRPTPLLSAATAAVPYQALSNRSIRSMVMAGSANNTPANNDLTLSFPPSVDNNNNLDDDDEVLSLSSQQSNRSKSTGWRLVDPNRRGLPHQDSLLGDLVCHDEEETAVSPDKLLFFMRKHLDSNTRCNDDDDESLEDEGTLSEEEA